MRWIIFILPLVLSMPLCRGQGTFVYDQQSADESIGSGAGIAISPNQPIGQSFTPTNSSVGFIRLWLAGASVNGFGAMVSVNLLGSSLTNGVLLGSSDSVSMPDGFGLGAGNHGYVDFLFSTPVTVIPGVTYYFQPVVQSGDSSWRVEVYNYYYPGGTLFMNGTADTFDDLWFREGIVVPEPSSVSLVLVGSGICFLRYRRRRDVSMSFVE